VFDLTLDNGSHVVLKMFPSSFEQTELRAIERCHAQMVAMRFPSPKQLAPLVHRDGVWSAFYELAPGRTLDGHHPESGER
jgi:hypothetical protein